MDISQVRKEIQWFIDGDHSSDAEGIRREYLDILKKAKPFERVLGGELAKLRVAFDKAIKEADVFFGDESYKGLRFRAGLIQSNGEPVDVEVEAGGKFIGIADRRRNPGRTPEEKKIIKEFLIKKGAKSSMIANAEIPVSTNAVVMNALISHFG